MIFKLKMNMNETMKKEFYVKKIGFIIKKTVLCTLFLTIRMLFSAEQLVERSTRMEEGTSSIYASYAIQNTLDVLILNTFESDPRKALLYSPLLGRIMKEWVQQEAYGQFDLVADPIKPDRFKKQFLTDTLLNKIARSMFDVIDKKVRPTALPSNPFLGLNAATIAKMVLVIKERGLEGLILLLEKQCKNTLPVEPQEGPIVKRQKKDVTSVHTLLSDWFKAYRDRAETGKDKEKAFKSKILTWCTLLTEYVNQPEMLQDKGQADRDFLKIIMTFLSLKDEKEGLLSRSYSLEDYFNTLGIPFTRSYYTVADKKMLKERFSLDDHDNYDALKNPKGLEDLCFYLSSCVESSINFLEVPYLMFVSTKKTDPGNRFNGDCFVFCAESAIRALINCILYDHATQKLNVNILPKKVSMNPGFKAFFMNHSDPQLLNYYENTLTEWLILVSGVPEAVYKNDGPQGPYEISAQAGRKNILAVVNFIFQTSAESFEDLGTCLSDDQRTITFSKELDGEKMLISGDAFYLEGELKIQEGIAHADFSLHQDSIFQLLENIHFLDVVDVMSEYCSQDLYQLIFKKIILSASVDGGHSTPLIWAIEKNSPDLVDRLLRYNADPNQRGGLYLREPLEHAINYADQNIIDLLLHYGAIITDDIIENACIKKKFSYAIRLLREQDQRGVAYSSRELLLLASRLDGVEVARFLLDKDPDLKDYCMIAGGDLLSNAVFSKSLSFVEFLIEECGISSTEKNSYEIRPLNVALSVCSGEIAHYLIKKKGYVLPDDLFNIVMEQSFPDQEKISLLTALLEDVWPWFYRQAVSSTGETLLEVALRASPPSSDLLLFLLRNNFSSTGRTQELCDIGISQNNYDLTSLALEKQIDFPVDFPVDVLVDVLDPANLTTDDNFFGLLGN